MRVQVTGIRSGAVLSAKGYPTSPVCLKPWWWDYEPPGTQTRKSFCLCGLMDKALDFESLGGAHTKDGIERFAVRVRAGVQRKMKSNSTDHAPLPKALTSPRRCTRTHPHGIAVLEALFLPPFLRPRQLRNVRRAKKQERT